MKLRDLATAPLFVFDVESIGLHGDPFSVGYVVMVGGKIQKEQIFSCLPATARGDADDREWVKENCPFLPPNCGSVALVLECFYLEYVAWKERKAIFAADCLWPVEANFLLHCIERSPADRKFMGPYPFIDVAVMRLAAGFDPMETCSREKDELPQHNPLCDARQSARQLWEAIQELILRDSEAP